MTSRTLRRPVPLLAVALALLVGACSSSDSSGDGTDGTASDGSTPGSSRPATAGYEYLVFNGQGNNLDAYEPTPPFDAQRVITTVAEDPEGLDINAQICFFPDAPSRFIAGEDTGQSTGDLQGWGIFDLEGSGIGDLTATQVGKLVPTYQGSGDNAENYGCGFLSDGRLLTTDVGNQALGPADGQLIIWFGPFDSFDVSYCKLDVDIATAQSIWIDGGDRVYVASARPSDEEGATAGGVFVYEGPFPTGPDAEGGCAGTDDTGAPLAEGVEPTLVIPSGDHGLLSPSGLAPAANGNLYVSSVFTGIINEYTTDGVFVRTILAPPEGETLGETPYSTGTPLGIATGPDGSLFYADIGLVAAPGDTPGPGNGTGTLRRIAFVDGEPQAPEIMGTDLAFPDGVGIYVP